MSTTDAPLGRGSTTAPASASTVPSKRASDWSWPLHRQHWFQLIGAFVALTATTWLVGWLLTDVFAPNEVTTYDDELAQQLADGRTETTTDLAHWGARLADTEIKIIVTAAIGLLFLALWKRWHETLFLVLTLVVEASAFVVASFLVGRSRPAVERLLDSPVDSSFPSGHVAAATVYSALIVIVFRHTRSASARIAVVAVCVPIPIVVGWARMYQGMHFLSDVVAGVLLGIATIAVCAWIMPTADERSDADASVPDDGRDVRDTAADDTEDRPVGTLT